MNTLLLFLLVAVCISCDEKSDEPYIARVSDRYLYSSDLNEVIPATVLREDSLKRAKVFINNWVREQVILRQAEFNVDASDDRFQKKVAQYLDDLIIYEYENNYVKQKLDTTFTPEQLNSYYEEHSAEYLLETNVVRVRYAIYNENTAGLGDIEKKFKRFNEKDSVDLEIHAAEYAVDYYDRGGEWMTLKELLHRLPLSFGADEAAYLKSTSYADVSKGGERILLSIEDYRLKDDVRPYGMVRERIVRSLLNSRKMGLLEDLRNSLFSEAISKGDIEIIEE